MIFLEMFVAFAATMAFAVIFNVSRSELIFCGIAGLVAEGVYLFTLRIKRRNGTCYICFVDCCDGIVADFGERKTYARYGLFDFGNNIACTRCGYV